MRIRIHILVSGIDIVYNITIDNLNDHPSFLEAIRREFPAMTMVTYRLPALHSTTSHLFGD